MDAAQLSKKRKRKHTKSASTSKEATPSDSMAKATLVSKADGNKALKKRKAEKESKKVKEIKKEVEATKEQESEKEEEDKAEIEEEEEEEEEGEDKKAEKAQNGDNTSEDDSDDSDDSKDKSGAGDDAPTENENGATLHPDRALALSIEDGTTIEDGNAIQDTNGDSTLPPGAQLHLPVTGAIPKLFSELNLHQSTMRAITENLKFTEMTEVQSRTIPPAMAGRDVLGAAKTGSGKTLAFLIPAIEMLSALRFKPRNGTGVLVRLAGRQF
jgi:ATP-dependent RNA helicase DDX18/HAS1